MKCLIDTLTRSIGTGGADSSWQATIFWIGLIGITTLLGDGCSVLGKLAQTIQAEAVSDRVYNLLHTQSIAMDLAYYEQTDYYNTFHRAQEQATYRLQLVLSGLSQVGQSSISLLGILALLAALNGVIPLLLLATTLPGMWLRFKYTGKAYGRMMGWTERERQTDYLHLLLTTEPYAKEIRLFKLGALFDRWFKTLRTSIRSEKIQLATQQAQIDLITNGSATIAVLCATGAIAQQTLQGSIGLGGFIMYYQAFQRGQACLRELLSHSLSLYEHSLFLQDFDRFLDLQPTIATPPQPQPLAATWKTGLCLENVSFDYPHSQRSVLKDLNLTVHPGEVVAIVGANGAGKTTLIKLLCRLYDPIAGKITLDGIDLRDYSIDDLHRQISVVFQDYARYQLTAGENIWLGNIELPATPDLIWQAAELAGARESIAKLPQGLDTQLGNLFDGGEELSIGQWQKIALARAFLRDASLIVLDEPTSALDPTAEAAVFDRFRQLVKGRMAIVISHRLSTIKLVDRIFVLDNGRLAECGSHAELMQQQGIYAQLFNTQAQHYQI